jgi:antitoxin component YwqK of YwqJK toxin-antitoxin module
MNLIYLENKCLNLHNSCFYVWNNNNKDYTCINCKRKIELEQDFEYKKYDNNGKLVIHCYYVNGLRNCEYKHYYEDGSFFIHCYYVDGKKDGEYKSYYPNGTLFKHCYYEKGVKINKLNKNQ